MEDEYESEDEPGAEGGERGGRGRKRRRKKKGEEEEEEKGGGRKIKRRRKEEGDEEEGRGRNIHSKRIGLMHRLAFLIIADLTPPHFPLWLQ